jgi:hypothetical protein
MFHDLFSLVDQSLNKKSPLKTAKNQFSFLTPSSQLCIDDNKKDIGFCSRQLWYEKNQYQKSDPKPKVNHVVMAADAGDYWENWFINHIKTSGCYVDNQIPCSHPESFVKGFADMLTTNPQTNKLELTEIKTFNGSEYYKQSIYGTLKIRPTPQMSHLLQAFRYLLVHNEEVDAVNLAYIDRSCSGWFKNKQFRITLFEHDSKFYPNIQFKWTDDKLHNYIEKSVTDVGLLEAEKQFLSYMREGVVPPSTYIPIYSAPQIEARNNLGLISKTSYLKYKEKGVSLGDFPCNYCEFKTTCLNHEYT